MIEWPQFIIYNRNFTCFSANSRFFRCWISQSLFDMYSTSILRSPLVSFAPRSMVAANLPTSFCETYMYMKDTSYFDIILDVSLMFYWGNAYFWRLLSLLKFLLINLKKKLIAVDTRVHLFFNNLKLNNRFNCASICGYYFY